MRRLTERAGIIELTVRLLPLVPLVIWAFSQRWLFRAAADRMGPARLALHPGPRHRVLDALASLSPGGGAGRHCAVVGGGLAGGSACWAYTPFRGKTLVEFLILAPTVVPAFAAAMGIQVLFIRYGLADTLGRCDPGASDPGAALHRADPGWHLRQLRCRLRASGKACERGPGASSGTSRYPPSSLGWLWLRCSLS